MSVIHSFPSFSNRFRAGVYSGNVLDGLPFAAQTLKQVHGTEIVEVTCMGQEMEGDALLTGVPGVRLLIKTADCIPLVFGDEKAGLAAAVHAGWRGLTADIVPKMIVHLLEKGARLDRLQLGVGPSLGVECAEFSSPFEEIPERYHWAIRPDRHVDLWAILERQLEESRIPSKNVEWMKMCTACDSNWFSWRRDKDARRFGSFIEILS